MSAKVPPRLTPIFRVRSKANWGGGFVPFRHQAQQVWEEQEAQWEKERKARERLMQEVDWFHVPVENFSSR